MSWSHSQFVQNQNFSAATSISATITAVPSGGIITACLRLQTAATPTGSDNKGGNTYNVINVGAAGGNNYYILYSAAPITNGPTSFTATFASVAQQVITVDVWNAPTGTSSITTDGTLAFDSGFAGSATLENGSNVTLSNSTDLAVSYGTSNTTVSASPWTFSGSGSSFIQSEFQTPSAGTIFGAWTMTGSWVIITFALTPTSSATPDMGGSAAIYRVQVPGWRWRAPPKGYTRRNGILLKAA